MKRTLRRKRTFGKKFLTQCGARLTSKDVHWPMQLSMKVAPGPLTRASGFRQRTREKQHERWLKKAKLGFGPYAGNVPSGSEHSAMEASSGGGSDSPGRSSGFWQSWSWHGWRDHSQWDWK